MEERRFRCFVLRSKVPDVPSRKPDTPDAPQRYLAFALIAWDSLRLLSIEGTRVAPWAIIVPLLWLFVGRRLDFSRRIHEAQRVTVQRSFSALLVSISNLFVASTPSMLS